MNNMKNHTVTDSNQGRFCAREVIEAAGEIIVDPESTVEKITLQVNQLEQALRDHFSDVMRRKLFEESVYRAPWLTPLSETLRQQHFELLDKIQQIKHLILAGEDAPDWRRQIQAAFGDVVELFYEQDAGVQNLMQALEQSIFQQESDL